FRDDVEEKLKQKLPLYEIQKGKQAIGNKYSKLWIYKKEWKESGFKFGIEPFSGRGHKNGYLFVGLYNKNPILNNIPEKNILSVWWKQTQPILTEDENKIKFQDVFTMKILAKADSEEYLRLLDNVVETT